MLVNVIHEQKTKYNAMGKYMFKWSGMVRNESEEVARSFQLGLIRKHKTDSLV